MTAFRRLNALHAKAPPCPEKGCRGALGVLRGRGLRDSDGISFSLFSDIALVFHFST